MLFKYLFISHNKDNSKLIRNKTTRRQAIRNYSDLPGDLIVRSVSIG